MTEKIFIDDLSDSGNPEVTPARKKQSLQEIISAVSEKEDVITAFKNPKNKNKLSAVKSESLGLQYLMMRFLGGMAFALGLVTTLLLAWFLIMHLPSKDFHALMKMFSKFVFLMKSLGN